MIYCNDCAIKAAPDDAYILNLVDRVVQSLSISSEMSNKSATANSRATATLVLLRSELLQVLAYAYFCNKVSLKDCCNNWLHSGLQTWHIGTGDCKMTKSLPRILPGFTFCPEVDLNLYSNVSCMIGRRFKVGLLCFLRKTLAFKTFKLHLLYDARIHVLI